MIFYPSRTFHEEVELYRQNELEFIVVVRDPNQKKYVEWELMALRT